MNSFHNSLWCITLTSYQDLLNPPRALTSLPYTSIRWQQKKETAQHPACSSFKYRRDIEVWYRKHSLSKALHSSILGDLHNSCQQSFHLRMQRFWKYGGVHITKAFRYNVHLHIFHWQLQRLARWHCIVVQLCSVCLRCWDASPFPPLWWKVPKISTSQVPKCLNHWISATTQAINNSVFGFCLFS